MYVYAVHTRKYAMEIVIYYSRVDGSHKQIKDTSVYKREQLRVDVHVRSLKNTAVIDHNAVRSLSRKLLAV